MGSNDHSGNSQIGLADLLGLGQVSEFLDQVWEESILHHSPSVSESTYFDRILSLDQFEQLLYSAGSDISIVQGQLARPVDPKGSNTDWFQGIYDQYLRGASVLLAGVQNKWAPVAHLCRQIENELLSHGILLKEAIGANAYLTPPGSQAFGIHYDNHCVVVLQLHGKKEWTVFAPNEILPIKRCDQLIPADQLDAPLLEDSLNQGDVLYIPRGFPHFANTGQQSSLHLTLSIRTMTWADVLNEMIPMGGEFRRSVQPGAKGSGSFQEYFQNELQAQFQNFNFDEFLGARLAGNLSKLAPLPSGRLRSFDQLETISPETVVERTKTIYCTVQETGERVALRFPGGNLQLHRIMKPVFEFVAGASTFTASDLPSVEGGEYDKVEFTRILIKKGLVRPQANNTTIPQPH